MPPSTPMPVVTPVTPPPTPPDASSLPPFEPPTPAAMNQTPPPKKGMPMKGVIGLLVLILTVVGAAAGFYLTQMNQDVRQQASAPAYSACDASSWCIAASIPGSTQCTHPVSGTLVFCCPAGQTGGSGSCAAGGGTGGPTVPGSCSGAVECRTYDCPNGMDYNNGQECRSSSVIVQAGTGCPAPASNCGQVDYYDISGNFDSYCGHNLYTDGCSTPPGGGTTPPGGGGPGSPTLACGTLIMTVGGTPVSTAKYGDTIKFICQSTSGTPPASTTYSFFITEPGKTERLLTTSTSTGYDYNVTYTGQYKARCDVN